MTFCASCGLEIIDGSELCRHHVPLADDWARSNRIMCDFFHRRLIPVRAENELSSAEWILEAADVA